MDLHKNYSRANIKLNYNEDEIANGIRNRIMFAKFSASKILEEVFGEKNESIGVKQDNKNCIKLLNKLVDCISTFKNHTCFVLNRYINYFFEKIKNNYYDFMDKWFISTSIPTATKPYAKHSCKKCAFLEVCAGFCGIEKSHYSLI